MSFFLLPPVHFSLLNQVFSADGVQWFDVREFAEQFMTAIPEISQKRVFVIDSKKPGVVLVKASAVISDEQAEVVSILKPGVTHERMTKEMGTPLAGEGLLFPDVP